MNAAVFALILAQPVGAPMSAPSSACAKMSVLAAGQLAPCSGILWSEDQTRMAVTCKDVTVPLLEADLKFIRSTAGMREQQHRSEVEFRDAVIKQMIENWPKPVQADIWQITAGILGGVLAGAAAVWLM